MTFDPEIPLVTESPLTSASPIQVNFSQYEAIFSSLLAGVNYNHMPLNNSNQGKHGAVIFQKQTADPTISTDEADLFAKNAVANIGTDVELFAMIPKFLPTNLDTIDAQNTPMQLTFNQVNIAGPVYQTFLPGGYIFYLGMTTDITVPITLAPIPTKICIAIASSNTSHTSSGNLPFNSATQILSNSQFKINSELNGTGPVIPYSFTWMAIAQQ